MATNTIQQLSHFIDPSKGDNELTVLHYFLTLYEQLNHFHNSVSFSDFPEDKLHPGTQITNLCHFASAIATIQSGLYFIYGHDNWKGTYYMKNIGYSAPSGRRKLKDRVRDHFTRKSDLLDRIGSIDKMEIYGIDDIVFPLSSSYEEQEEIKQDMQKAEVLRAIEYVLVALLKPKFPDTSPLPEKSRKWISHTTVLRVVMHFIDKQIIPAFVYSSH